MWARQLYMRIQQPMDIFAANKTILQYPEAKKIIKNYNQLSKILLSYEILYHRGWRRQVMVVATGIHSSIFIRVNRDYLLSAGDHLLHYCHLPDDYFQKYLLSRRLFLLSPYLSPQELWAQE